MACAIAAEGLSVADHQTAIDREQEDATEETPAHSIPGGQVPETSGESRVTDEPREPVDGERDGRIRESVVVAIVLGGLLLLVGFDVVVSQWPARRLPVERLPQHEFDFRLDVNTANEMELIQLPGIGPKLAARIVADREAKGAFQSVEDIQRVHGIGPAIAEQIAPYLKWPGDAERRP